MMVSCKNQESAITLDIKLIFWRSRGDVQWNLCGIEIFLWKSFCHLHQICHCMLAANVFKADVIAEYLAVFTNITITK